MASATMPAATVPAPTVEAAAVEATTMKTTAMPASTVEAPTVEPAAVGAAAMKAASVMAVTMEAYVMAAPPAAAISAAPIAIAAVPAIPIGIVIVEPEVIHGVDSGVRRAIAVIVSRAGCTARQETDNGESETREHEITKRHGLPLINRLASFFAPAELRARKRTVYLPFPPAALFAPLTFATSSISS
jgi:hypothetical protein